MTVTPMEFVISFTVAFLTVAGLIVGIAERRTWIDPMDSEPEVLSPEV